MQKNYNPDIRTYLKTIMFKILLKNTLYFWSIANQSPVSKSTPNNLIPLECGRCSLAELCMFCETHLAFSKIELFLLCLNVFFNSYVLQHGHRERWREVTLKKCHRLLELPPMSQYISNPKTVYTYGRKKYRKHSWPHWHFQVTIDLMVRWLTYTQFNI